MSPFSPDAAAFRAGRLMLEEVERYAGLKETFGLETTLSGLGHCGSIAAPHTLPFPYRQMRCTHRLGDNPRL
jgi:predicted ABC-type ATPase